MKKLSTLILLFICFVGCKSKNEQPVTLPSAIIDEKGVIDTIVGVVDTTVTIVGNDGSIHTYPHKRYYKVTQMDSLIAKLVAISVKNAVDNENNRWAQHGITLLRKSNKILSRLNSNAINHQQAVIELSELFIKINYPHTHR